MARMRAVDAAPPVSQGRHHEAFVYRAAAINPLYFALRKHGVS